MKMRIWLAFLMAACLILAGCQNKPGTSLLPGTPPLPDTEPTAVYNWMAGESPVPNERIGVRRSSVSWGNQAVSPQGTYFLAEADPAKNCYILYADHGSDTFIKLCGRPDCSHSGRDCNAYVYSGRFLSYYNGYLYVVSGLGGGDRLIRMNPDGSNHVTVLEFQKFAKEHNAEGASFEMISKGICTFSLYNYTEKEMEVNGRLETYLVPVFLCGYMYKLDGSIPEPQKTKGGATPFYHCGDVFFSIADSEITDGCDSVWDWDPETDSYTYLTEYPKIPGYYGPEEAYYFRDGAIVRLNYTTQTEEILIDTGLEGEYYLFCFPECMVVASRTAGADKNLYVYNWANELVDTVEGPESYDAMDRLLLAETAERFIFSNSWDGLPLYYINKADLGTGNAKLHSFKLPDL